MLAVSVIVEVKENASEGSIVAVFNSETISSATGSEQDVWISAGEAVERLVPDVRARVLQQIQAWTVAAGNS